MAINPASPAAPFLFAAPLPPMARTGPPSQPRSRLGAPVVRAPQVVHRYALVLTTVLTTVPPLLLEVRNAEAQRWQAHRELFAAGTTEPPPAGTAGRYEAFDGTAKLAEALECIVRGKPEESATDPLSKALACIEALGPPRESDTAALAATVKLLNELVAARVLSKARAEALDALGRGLVECYALEGLGRQFLLQLEPAGPGQEGVALDVAAGIVGDVGRRTADNCVLLGGAIAQLARCERAGGDSELWGGAVVNVPPSCRGDGFVAIRTLSDARRLAARGLGISLLVPGNVQYADLFPRLQAHHAEVELLLQRGSEADAHGLALQERLAAPSLGPLLGAHLRAAEQVAAALQSARLACPEGLRLTAAAVVPHRRLMVVMRLNLCASARASVVAACHFIDWSNIPGLCSEYVAIEGATLALNEVCGAPPPPDASARNARTVEALEKYGDLSGRHWAFADGLERELPGALAGADRSAPVLAIRAAGDAYAALLDVLRGDVAVEADRYTLLTGAAAPAERPAAAAPAARRAPSGAVPGRLQGIAPGRNPAHTAMETATRTTLALTVVLPNLLGRIVEEEPQRWQAHGPLFASALSPVEPAGRAKLAEAKGCIVPGELAPEGLIEKAAAYCEGLAPALPADQGTLRALKEQLGEIRDRSRARAEALDALGRGILGYGELAAAQRELTLLSEQTGTSRRAIEERIAAVGAQAAENCALLGSAMAQLGHCERAGGDGALWGGVGVPPYCMVDGTQSIGTLRDAVLVAARYLGLSLFVTSQIQCNDMFPHMAAYDKALEGLDSARVADQRGLALQVALVQPFLAPLLAPHLRVAEQVAAALEGARQACPANLALIAEEAARYHKDLVELQLNICVCADGALEAGLCFVDPQATSVLREIEDIIVDARALNEACRMPSWPAAADHGALYGVMAEALLRHSGVGGRYLAAADRMATEPPDALPGADRGVLAKTLRAAGEAHAGLLDAARRVVAGALVCGAYRPQAAADDSWMRADAREQQAAAMSRKTKKRRLRVKTEVVAAAAPAPAAPADLGAALAKQAEWGPALRAGLVGEAAERDPEKLDWHARDTHALAALARGVAVAAGAALKRLPTGGAARAEAAGVLARAERESEALEVAASALARRATAARFDVTARRFVDEPTEALLLALLEQDESRAGEKWIAVTRLPDFRLGAVTARGTRRAEAERHLIRHAEIAFTAASGMPGPAAFLHGHYPHGGGAPLWFHLKRPDEAGLGDIEGRVVHRGPVAAAAALAGCNRYLLLGGGAPLPAGPP